MDKNQNNIAKALVQSCFLQTNSIIQNTNSYVIQQHENIDSIRQTCPFIEWEQDMSRRIPFCGKFGGFCNGQCISRVSPDRKSW